jgi:hypothetical protein
MLRLVVLPDPPASVSSIHQPPPLLPPPTGSSLRQNKHSMSSLYSSSGIAPPGFPACNDAFEDEIACSIGEQQHYPNDFMQYYLGHQAIMFHVPAP